MLLPDLSSTLLHLLAVQGSAANPMLALEQQWKILADSAAAAGASGACAGGAAAKPGSGAAAPKVAVADTPQARLERLRGTVEPPHVTPRDVQARRTGSFRCLEWHALL